jgi:hypothetical protein
MRGTTLAYVKQAVLSSRQWKPRDGYVLVFSIASLIRLAYAFYLQKILWGRYRFETADTSSYLDAFRNLVKHGKYCFDLTLVDSCFYRLPTYPFFIGIQDSLFGSQAWISIAIVQAAIDSGSCVLAVFICRSLGRGVLTQWLTAIIFIFYPFTIFWVPQQMPEVLGVFLVLAFLAVVVSSRGGIGSIIASGALLVLAVWSKQYVAAILPAVFFFVAANRSDRGHMKTAVGILMAFAILFSPWIARNKMNYGQWAPLMGETTGVRLYLTDYTAAVRFVGLFYQNPTSILDGITREGLLPLPPSSFVAENRAEIDKVVGLAFDCGPSFRAWRGERVELDADARKCERNVANGFNELSERARQELGVFPYFRTAMEAFAKGFVKTDYVETSGSSPVQSLLFAYRGVLVFLGFSMVFLVRQRRLVLFAAGSYIFWLATLVVLAFRYRHLEMRYLLMADAALFVCASIALGSLLSRFVPDKWMRQVCSEAKAGAGGEL